MVQRKTMRMRSLIAFFLLVILSGLVAAKGARGGMSSRGGGYSSSRGGSSRPSGSSGSSGGGGWFSGKSGKSSAPAPAYKPPSYSPSANKAPSSGWNINANNNPSPSHTSGTNTNSKPIGWNVGNTQASGSKPVNTPNIGFNGGSKPAGPPPAYPGLSNRPLSGNAPPAYSPSFSNPPAYNAKSPSAIFSNNIKPPASAYGPRGGFGPSYPGSYGSTFGSGGLGSNTFIHNNYYGSGRSGGGFTSFLTNALFYGVSMHHGFMWGSYNRRRSWDDEDDRKWRATTKAPYFENKVPGSESFLPAAAVVGAATAFGLTSLLPLNVPANKPLLYCNVTQVAQTHIRLDDNIYSCGNLSIAMSCPRSVESAIVDECLNKTMVCDVKDEATADYFCTNATLVSRAALVCNTTTIVNGTNENETSTVLHCFRGALPARLASFIPTTTTEAPITTTTEKKLSMNSKIHVFFLKLVGKGHILNASTSTPATLLFDDDDSRFGFENQAEWIPEALTLPPGINEVPDTLTVLLNDGVEEPLNGVLLEFAENLKRETGTYPPNIIKIPDTPEARRNLTGSN